MLKKNNSTLRPRLLVSLLPKRNPTEKHTPNKKITKKKDFKFESLGY